MNNMCKIAPPFICINWITSNVQLPLGWGSAAAFKCIEVYKLCICVWYFGYTTWCQCLMSINRTLTIYGPNFRAFIVVVPTINYQLVPKTISILIWLHYLYVHNIYMLHVNKPHCPLSARVRFLNFHSKIFVGMKMVIIEVCGRPSALSICAYMYILLYTPSYISILHLYWDSTMVHVSGLMPFNRLTNHRIWKRGWWPISVWSLCQPVHTARTMNAMTHFDWMGKKPVPRESAQNMMDKAKSFNNNNNEPIWMLLRHRSIHHVQYICITCNHISERADYIILYYT